MSDRGAAQPVAYCGDTTLEWRDFQAQVMALAAQLARHPGNSWMLACRDAYYFLCAFFAVLQSGKQVVIPPNFQPGTLASLQAEVDGWLVDDLSTVPAGQQPWLLVPTPAPAMATPPKPIADDAVVDLFTSGTTGRPKRIRKRLAQLAAEVEVLESLWGEQLQAAAVVSTVPHYHIYGLLFRLLWPLYAGRAFDVAVCGNPNELVQRLQKLGRAAVISSPAQLSRLPELTDPAKLAPQAVQIFSSGGPLPPTAAQAFADVLGRAPTEVYGSSETGGIAWRTQTGTVDGSAWAPLPRVDIRTGEDGALHVRSPFIDAHDWFVTADGADIQADGRFRLLGRLDRIVKLEEKRLSLTELEDRLRQHPLVAEAGSVLLEGSRRLLGVVLALNKDGQALLQHRGRRALVDEMKLFLAQHYEAPLLPRQWRFTETLPQNDRGKVSSQALAALFTPTEQRDS